MDRTNIPYYQVAKEALIKWNGLSEKEADKIIEQSSLSMKFENVPNFFKHKP